MAAARAGAPCPDPNTRGRPWGCPPQTFAQRPPRGRSAYGLAPPRMAVRRLCRLSEHPLAAGSDETIAPGHAETIGPRRRQEDVPAKADDARLTREIRRVFSERCRQINLVLLPLTQDF